MSRFVGKVALITGGGRGIGRATALRLASEGAAVAVLDLDGAVADEAAEALRAAGARALALAADVTDRAAGRAAIEQTLAELERIDVLVNNAARTAKGNLEQTGPDDWTYEIEGTLTGAFLMSRAVLPHMIARGNGAIVNVASVNGLLALGNPAYSAAKAGLINLTRSLATEYGPRGIRANAVSPGTIRTESPSWRERVRRDPQVFDKLARWYPVGRSAARTTSPPRSRSSPRTRPPS